MSNTPGNSARGAGQRAISEMTITERQCKFGIWIGLVVGVAIPILMIAVPFSVTVVRWASGTLTQESFAQNVTTAQYLQTAARLPEAIGPLILLASWWLLKHKRKEKEVR